MQEELTNAGWDSVAPTLPIENPRLSFEDHAEIVKRALLERGAKEVAVGAHSWGANIAPWIGAPVVKNLILIAPAFHPATLKDPDSNDTLVSRSLMYESWKRYEASAGFDLDAIRDFASYAFYHDVMDEELKREALSRLRAHPSREDEPELGEFPHLPLGFILLNDDKALLREAQRRTAKVLGVEPKEIKSGHAPMLSSPKELAGLLIELATKE